MVSWSNVVCSYFIPNSYQLTSPTFSFLSHLTLLTQFRDSLTPTLVMIACVHHLTILCAYLGRLLQGLRCIRWRQAGRSELWYCTKSQVNLTDSHMNPPWQTKPISLLGCSLHPEFWRIADQFGLRLSTGQGTRIINAEIRIPIRASP